MDFEIDAAAIQEIGAAFRYYQERAPVLGYEFLDDIRWVFAQILMNPQAGTLVEQDIRRRLTRRFPYCVFYLASAERITILAVAHQRRDPGHRRLPP